MYVYGTFFYLLPHFTLLMYHYSGTRFCQKVEAEVYFKTLSRHILSKLFSHTVIL